MLQFKNWTVDINYEKKIKKHYQVIHIYTHAHFLNDTKNFNLLK